MTYVRAASCFKEQNLILNQQGQSLFYTTTKVIHPKQELRVWYSLPYARKHGLPSLLPMKFDTQGCGESLKTWSCFQCNKNFANPVYLQCHLNVHELDKIKEVSDGKSAEKENHNLNQKNVPTFHSKKLKNMRTKCEGCKCECKTCSNDLQQKCSLKKGHASHSRSRKYLCEVCGYQFSQPLVRSCHVRRRLKDTNMNDSSEQVPGFPRTKLHVPRKGISSQDLCCPKCTKREETSDFNSIEHDISKEMQLSQPTNAQTSSLPEQQILIQSSTNASSNLNDQTDFLETRMETVDVNAEEFLSPEDDHQLNSVLNAFKLGDHKLAGSLDLQDLSLAVQQPQTDLLEQTLLSAPLNGDLTDSVVCFGNYDDVKISIVDPNMETVGSFTDILLEPTCVENTISNEISDSSLPQQTPELNSKYKVTKNSEVECQTPTIEDNFQQKSRTRKGDSSNNSGFQQVNKSVLARVSALLPASYLTIRKCSRKRGEQSGCGVFARKTIRQRTCFGPIEGFLRTSTFSPESKGQKLKNKLVFLVETGPDKVQALDISRKNAFNWMRFVRVAQSCNEQNVILSQQGQSLFLTTTKVIHPREELRVWYSLVYARRHGLPFLQPLKLGLKGTCDPSSTWLCFKCSDRFVSSGDLQYHLNIHNLDTLKMETNTCVRKATCALCSKKATYKNKDYASKCQICKSQYRPCHVIQHNDNQKKQKPSNSRSKKYLCEFCGFQFSHSYNRDRHVQRHHNDTNMSGTYKSLPANEKLIKPEKVESKTNSAWYCSHCNQHFRSASVCNLHTLVHAAENVEETEVITGVPNDFPTLPKKAIESDLRCPKCTKKVETSDGASRLECGVSKVVQPSQPASSLSNSHSDKEAISSGDSSLTFNLNSQNNFMETRVVGMDTSEFLAHNSADDDHHINSVLNSLKMQGLVIDEGENGSLQLRPSQTDETCVDDKLGDAIQLQELSLAVQQQERDLLQQTLLGGPLNGDISGSVSHLDQSLLNDDDKMSIVDPSQETVGAYTDILMENTSVENAIAHEITENSLTQKALEICTNSKQNDKLPDQKTSVGEDKSIRSCEFKDCKEENSLNISSIQDKPVLAIALPSFPSAFLAIRKLPPKKTEKIVYGVFARKILSKRMQFGPIEGIFVKDKDHLGSCQKQYDNSKDLVLSIEMESGDLQKLYVNPGDSWCWMKYIRTAPSFKERNLVLNQNGQSLFFMTTKVIHPKEELRVWYSLPYAIKRNLPLLNPDVLIRKNLEDMGKVWPCFECSEKFTSSEALQIHLNIHDFEREDEDPLDKRLMRKTIQSFRRKGIHNFSPRKYKSSSNKPSEGFPYQCHTCHRAFPRNYNLKRHELLHAKDKKYMCEVCGCQFTHVYNRDRHIRKRHKDLNKNGNSKLSAFLKKKLGLKSNSQSVNNTNMEWCCSHCSLGFDSLRVLNIHTLSHGNREFMFDNENLKCPQCCEEFITKKELVDHVAEHGKLLSQTRLRGSSNPAKPWKCELCYKSFATEDRLQRHMLVHGAEESKPLQCDICYKRFLNNSALACHIKIHTAEKKMFECPICKMVFEQVLSLKEHVHCHSENGVYTCPQCNKVFDDFNQIRKHVRAFHSSKSFPCSLCEKVFPRPDKLKLHMLRHSDHREFLCANCGKQFKRKDKLKEHMKRMHSAERELRLAMKPHRPPTAKKFMPKVSPTDYHRFIYKCHTCLLGFKRRGMLVNHLAKRHPDISPESVPELNLPILKTTRDYYCQYCEKVYKSSSKRKAHILKIHPGAELPMSNRRKGGVPEIPGFPNPTFSQTVGSITTLPHGCPWCHKQYASKAKLLQHQRKKHIDLLPQSQQVPRLARNPSSPSRHEDKTVSSPQLASVDEQEPPLSGADQQMILPQTEQDTQHQSDSALTQLQGIENVINIIPGDYHISTTEEDLRDFQESGIIIDTSAMERPLKVLPDGISADLLSQAMSELTNEFRVSVSSSPNDHYLRIVQTSPGHITVTQSPSSPENCDKDALTPSTNTVIGDSDTMSPTSDPNQTSQLHHLLSESYSLPSSPPSSPSPQTWANAHVTFTPYTAR
ncbi:hypothetical protein R5R35_014436 [Gryllus longicercus]|uniref:PR domain zinc finger protein 10 n=1 Tax=Gryllus longicercus TaxID=2509291 RepID=A0AAN9V3B4_9ORTH